VKPLTWKRVAEYFDDTGNLSVRHRNGKGNNYRLRIPSYDQKLLKGFRELLGRGNISRETKPRGPYYRLEVGGLSGTCEVLDKLLPHLKKKRQVAQQWLRDFEPFVGLTF
jgi:hypothetical protein